MVLDDQLRPLHKLTPIGEKHYQQYLETVADEILFKYQHPFKWLCKKLIDILLKLHWHKVNNFQKKSIRFAKNLSK